jgi:hypothetical protein
MGIRIATLGVETWKLTQIIGHSLLDQSLASSLDVLDCLDLNPDLHAVHPTQRPEERTQNRTYLFIDRDLGVKSLGWK